MRTLLEFLKKNKDYLTFDGPEVFRIENKTTVKNIDKVDLLPKDLLGSDDIFSIRDETNDCEYESIDELKEAYKTSDQKTTYLIQDNEVKITTTIRKKNLVNKIRNEYIFFSVKNFMENIKNLNVNEENIKKIKIYIIGENIQFESRYMKITSDLPSENNQDILINNVDLENFILVQKHFKDKVSNLLYYPMTWWEDGTTNTRLNSKFINLFFNLISIKSHKLDSRIYFIEGKNASINLDLTENEFNNNTMVKTKELASFCEDQLRIKDKIAILRESLVAHLPRKANKEDLEESIDVIVQSVKGTFDSYIENSLKLFTEQKNKLIDEYTNTAKEVSSLIAGIEDRLKDFMLALLATTLLTFLDQNHGFFRTALLNIALIAYSLFCAASAVIVFSIKNRYEKAINNLNSYTKSFGNVVKDFDFEKLEEEYVGSSKKQFWIMFSITMIITCLTGLLFFAIYLGYRWHISWGVEVIQFIKMIVNYR